MSVPSKLEKDYMKALGYLKAPKISKLNKRLIKKLIDARIPLDVVKTKAANINYRPLSDAKKEKFIDSLINEQARRLGYDPDPDGENTRLVLTSVPMDAIYDSTLLPYEDPEEDVFVDAKERIPKPKHKETNKQNNNLSKMSKGVTFDQRRGIPLGNYNDFMGMHVKDNGVRKHNEAFLKKAEPIMNTTYDYSAKYEHPDYAAAYAKKIGGKAYMADINDDKIEDIIITNKNGRIKYVNGHTIKPSSRGKDLKYYKSEQYEKAPFQYTNKNGRVVKDLYGQHPRAEFNKTLTAQDKKDANKLLRSAGFATYQVKEKTLNKILKESAETLYKNVINAIQNKHKDVSKTDLNRRLTMARFETLIVNAILLKMYKADFSKSKSYLDQLVADLKKVWDKDKNTKTSVINHANQAIDALSNPEVLDKLAEPLYKITLADTKHGEIYQAIIKLIGDAVKIDQQINNYLTSEVSPLEEARKKKANEWRKQYYIDHPDKKPKSKKKASVKPKLKLLDESEEEELSE